MAKNINRDYLVVLDVKSGNITAPKLTFFNSDNRTSNIYVQLVMKDLGIQVEPLERGSVYSVIMNVIKPDNTTGTLESVVVNEDQCIFEFNLDNDYTTIKGDYKIEFLVNTAVNKLPETTTSQPYNYTVYESILTGLDIR